MTTEELTQMVADFNNSYDRINTKLDSAETDRRALMAEDVERLSDNIIYKTKPLIMLNKDKDLTKDYLFISSPFIFPSRFTGEPWDCYYYPFVKEKQGGDKSIPDGYLVGIAKIPISSVARRNGSEITYLTGDLVDDLDKYDLAMYLNDFDWDELIETEVIKTMEAKTKALTERAVDNKEIKKEDASTKADIKDKQMASEIGTHYFDVDDLEVC